MTRNVGIYCRISQDRVGAGLGVERQEQECRELAARLGHHVVAVHVDNDLSAYSGKPRPGYEQLLADVQSGRIDAIVAWHTDRLHRSPVELERYIDAARDIPTLTVRAGELDLSVASGRMTARIVGAVARHESEQKSERLMAQKAQARADGKWLGGRRPFGYLADAVTPHPVEAPLVLEATKGVLAGNSLHSTARDWNARGIRTTTGSTWGARNLRRVLERPRNAGLIGPVGQVLGEAKWAPIVPRDTWEALCSLLNDPSRLTHQSVSRKLLGSFLYMCECGAKITSGGHGHKGEDRYACADNHMRRAAAPIDELVRKLVTAWLVKHNIQLIPRTVDVTSQRERLDVLLARAGEVAGMLGDPDSGMTVEQFKLTNSKLQEEIREVKAEISRRTSSTVLAGIADAEDPGRAFLEAPIERQRTIIDALCTVVVRKVGQGKRVSLMSPDESLRIEWKRVPG